MAPRWPGVLLPWATNRAEASKTPAEKSSPSRTASENAVRLSAPLISSAMEIKEFQMSVSVIGSICRCASLGMAACPIDLDHEMSKLIYADGITGKNDGRAFTLLDQTRTLEDIRRLHAVAVDDLAWDHAAALGKIGLPFAHGGWARCVLRAISVDHSGAGIRERGNHVPVRRLDRRVRIHEAVFASIGVVEGQAHLVLIEVINGAARQRDLNIVALSAVAHVSRARNGQGASKLEPCHLSARSLFQLVQYRRDLA